MGTREKEEDARHPLRRIILFAALVALTILLRLYPLLQGEFLGPDSYYHASVIRAGLETGRLSNANPLARCPWGVTEGPPLGFYALPYLLGHVLDVKFAMAITVLVFSVFAVLAGRALLSRLFSEEIAWIGAFLFATSFSFLQRSSALTYRGDLFGMPFLFLALYWGVGAMEEGQGRATDAVLSGAALGMSSFFWDGFPVLVVMYWTALFFGLFILWIHHGIRVRGERHTGGGEEEGILPSPSPPMPEWVSLPPVSALLSLAVSLLLFEGASLLSPQVGLRAVFFRHMPFISGGLVLVLILWSLLWREDWQKKGLKIGWGRRLGMLPALLAAVVAVIAVVALSGGFSGPISGPLHALRLFGGSTAFFSTVSELQPTSLEDLWAAFGLVLALALPGAVLLFIDFNARKAVFLGWLLSIAPLIVSARRFIPFSSLPLLSLAALVLVTLSRMFSARTADAHTDARTNARTNAPSGAPPVADTATLESRPRTWTPTPTPTPRWSAYLAFALVLLVCVQSIGQASRFLLPIVSPSFTRFAQSSGTVIAGFAAEDGNGSRSPPPCLVTMWDLGSVVEWHGRVPVYTASVGGQDTDRIERTTRFLLGNSSFDPGDVRDEANASFFFLVREEDLLRLLRLNPLANVTDIGLVRLDKVEKREQGNLTVYRLNDLFYVAISPEGAEAAYIQPASDLIGNGTSAYVTHATHTTDEAIPVSLFMPGDAGVFQAYREDAPGCLYLGETNYYFNRQLCESNAVRMLTMRPVPGLQPILSEKGVVLYGPDHSRA